MRVFQGIDPTARHDGLLEGVRAVLPRLHMLSVPRSLCEFELDGERYERF